MRRLRSLVLLLLAAPATLAAAQSENVAQTWNRAYAWVQVEDEDYRLIVIDGQIQADYMRRILESLSPAEPRGVIIHLHDCAFHPGYLDIRTQARFMASLGYVVFAPNSLARPDRPATCDTKAAVRFADAPLRAVHEMRKAELDYAIERVLALPWVDANRIFVSGFGEGGDAVVDYGHDAIRGRIAIGTSCRMGVDLREPIPTLILTSLRDRWYRYSSWPRAGALCRHKTDGDPYVEIMEPDGGLHEALIYGEARVALWNFLVRAAYQRRRRTGGDDDARLSPRRRTRPTRT